MAGKTININVGSNHGVNRFASRKSKLIDPIKTELDDKILQIQRKVCLSKMSLSYYADCGGGNFQKDIEAATLYGILDLIDDIYEETDDLYCTIFPEESEEPSRAGELAQHLDSCNNDNLKMQHLNNYLKHKKQNPGNMLAYRIDDDYYLYFEDAINAAHCEGMDGDYDEENIIYRVLKDNIKEFAEGMAAARYKLAMLEDESVRDDM